MPILITLLAVTGLLVLIVLLKWHPFVALVLVAVVAGLALGMPVEATLASVTSGVGSTLGGLALILGLGAALGGVIAETGAAQVITDRLIAGRRGNSVLWGLCLVGFLIGIPLFYTVAFVMMAPIIFATAKKTGMPLVMIAVASVASLSVTHGFLPPHPAPVLIADTYGADLGKTLLYGLLLAIPSVIIAGPIFARTLRGMPQTTGAVTIDDVVLPPTLPGLGRSIFCALLPVLLLAGTALLRSFDVELMLLDTPLLLVGDATIALLIGLVVAMSLLGRQTGQSVAQLMARIGPQLAPMAAVLLIIAGGGAFKQVLVDSGTSEYIVATLEGFNAHPLVIAWLIAAALRVTLGSATVAAITAAGIALPLANSGTSPELLVLATGAGSLTCSHVNDTGFWLFKEYFGLSVTQTLRSWTVMETVVSLVGLGGCLLLSGLIA